MRAVTYTYARQNFGELLDQAVDDHVPLIIAKADRAVVVMSVEDYESLEKKLQLLVDLASNSEALER